jgi:hypothetical protein
MQIRAQKEEVRKKTLLPYRHGLLLGCLGISSKGYYYCSSKPWPQSLNPKP